MSTSPRPTATTRSTASRGSATSSTAAPATTGSWASSGNDLYVFGRGYGTDTILDDGGDERIQFSDIAWTRSTFSRTALDLIMTRHRDRRADHPREPVCPRRQRSISRSNISSSPTALVVHRLQSRGHRPRRHQCRRGDHRLQFRRDARRPRRQRHADRRRRRRHLQVRRRLRPGRHHRPPHPRRLDATAAGRQGRGIEDAIEFGDDIRYRLDKNVVFTKRGDDLIISVRDRTDTLRITQNQFRSVEDADREVRSSRTALDPRHLGHRGGAADRGRQLRRRSSWVRAG